MRDADLNPGLADLYTKLETSEDSGQLGLN